MIIIIIIQELWGRINLLLSFKTTRAAKKKHLGDTKEAKRSQKPPPFLKVSKSGKEARHECTEYY
jgi:hypothetical protein